jgi:predicted nuclease of restriction endonuclease-like (RecB) superfamily
VPAKKSSNLNPPVPLETDGRLARGRTREDARFTAPPSLAGLPDSYGTTLEEIKSHLRSARVRAVLAANPIVIEAYWHTGKIILQRQQEAAWGAKVIDRLASDLREAFPGMRGLSTRNLLSMKLFADAFPDGTITKQPVSQLPWGHVIRLLQMVKDSAVRDFYIQQTISHGWSRSILEIQIQNRLHLRAGRAQSNFALTMPPVDSDMAAQLFKDPYLFDFLGTADPRREVEVEQALVEHIQQFLLELGAGFAFVGRQVHLEVGDEDFYLDLLFYHLKLRRYVVIELKARAFEPGDAGQIHPVRYEIPICLHPEKFGRRQLLCRLHKRFEKPNRGTSIWSSPFNKRPLARGTSLLRGMPQPSRRHQKRKISKDRLGKTLYKESTCRLSHGVNLYRSAVDDLLRHPDDQPTIGLLLCKGKNKVLVEYALSGLEQSIAVADWKTQLTETLPPEFQGSLPTIQEIEAELSRDLQKEEER